MQYTNLGLGDDFNLFPSANQYHTIIPVKNINIISDVRCPLLFFVFVVSELRMRVRKNSFCISDLEVGECAKLVQYTSRYANPCNFTVCIEVPLVTPH